MANFTFRLSSTGVEELKRELDALGPAGSTAFQRIAQTSPQLQNALTAAEAKIDQTRESLTRFAAANQNVTASIVAGMSAAGRAAVPFRDYNAELTRGLSAAGRAAAANTALAGSTKLASFQVLQLGQQFQDLSLQIAGGQNPLLAVAQQGSQAAFIMGGFGASVTAAKNAVLALTRAMRANPMMTAAGVAVAAITAAAAAVAIFGTNTGEAARAQRDLNAAMDRANELLEENRRQVKLTDDARRVSLENEASDVETKAARLEREIERRREFIRGLAAPAGGAGQESPEAISAAIARAIAGDEQLQELNKDLAEARLKIVDLRTEAGRFDDVHDAMARAAASGAEAIRKEGDAAKDAAAKLAEAAAKITDVHDAAARAAATGFEALGDKFTDAVALINGTIDSGLTDQQKYEKQVSEINDALEFAAAHGFKLSAEGAAALNRRLREMDPAVQAAKEALAQQTRDVLHALDLRGAGRKKIADKEAKDLQDAKNKIQRAADEQARSIARQSERVADDVVDFWTDSWISIENDGKAAFDNIWENALASAKRFAARLAAEVFVRPIVVPIAAAFLGGGTGALGPANAAFGGAGAVSQFSGAGGLGLGAASLIPTAAGVNALGASAFGLANVSPSFVGPLLPGQTVGATLSGVLGAAGLGALGGMLLGPAFGLHRTGSTLGGGAGAALGLILSGGNPLGAVAGGILGGVAGGLFGPGKRTPDARANIDVRGGRLLLGQSASDEGGNLSAAAAAAQTAADALAAVLQQFDATLNARGDVGAIRLRDNSFRSIVLGQERGFGQGEQGAQAAVADFVLRVLRSGRVEGLSGIERRVIGASQATDIAGLNEDLTFAKFFEQMKDGAANANVFADQIEALEDQFEDAGRKAVQLGLNTDVIVSGFQKAKDALRDSLTAPIDAFLKGLKTSALSPGTPLDRLAAARSQFQDVAARARAGDAAALAAFPAAGQELLTIGRQIYASTAQFAALFNEVSAAAESVRKQAATAGDGSKDVVKAIQEAQREQARRQAEEAAAQRAETRAVAAKVEDMRRDVVVRLSGSTTAGGFRNRSGGGNGR